MNRPDRRRPGPHHAMRTASEQAGAPGGASALQTERPRKIEDSAAIYLPGLATADSSWSVWQAAGNR
jgi:hypothetical protein